jgi:hypothetical protein
MNERTFRCPPLALLIFALLLALPGLAAAEESPRRSPQARVDFEAIAPAQAKCGACAIAHKSCSATCFGQDKAVMGQCLTACDNAAANCSCEQAVGLHSEELVNFEWPSMTKTACHGTVSCQPNYPSCASWSAYSDCEDPYCGSGPKCGECTCDEWGHCFCGPGPALKQRRERFRVCFDQYSNSCTEWQQTITSFCDETCGL